MKRRLLPSFHPCRQASWVCLEIIIILPLICKGHFTKISEVVHKFGYPTGSDHKTSATLRRNNGKIRWSIDEKLNREDDADLSPSPSSSCGGVINANIKPNGTIAFQGDQNIIQSNQSCKWVIKAKPGQKIVGEFKDFSIGASTGSDCMGGDYIKIIASPYVGKGENINEMQQTHLPKEKDIEKYKSMRYCMGNPPNQKYYSIGDMFTLELTFQHQNRNLQLQQDVSVDDMNQYKSNIILDLEEEGHEKKEEEEEISRSKSIEERADDSGSFTFHYWLETNTATCGDQAQESQFLFHSLNYPSAIPNVTSNCGLKIEHDCASPVCQLRLDLLEFELSQPDSGDCNRDQFIMRADEPLPVLCGKNTKQHLFIDVRGRKETDINVLTTPLYPRPVGRSSAADENSGGSSETEDIMDWLYELTMERKWKIRVTQIPCDCHDRQNVPEMEPAPAGCLQHYRGIVGAISSFNYDGIIRNLEPCHAGINNEINCNETIFTGHLNNLDYTICIAGETGYCGVAYTPKKEFDVGSGLLSSGFQMDGTANERRHPDLEFPPKFGESQCKEDYIQIPRGHHPEDVGVRYPSERYCGVKFGNRVEGSVISNARPMIVRVKMDEQENGSGVAINDRGFSLNYQQIPCTASKADAVNFT